MKNKLNFAIIYGSTRKKRNGIRFALYLKKTINKTGNNAFLIDPLENKFPLLDKRYEEYEKKSLPDSIKKVQKILNKSDGFIILSAEYNHMPPPALINTLNFFYKEYDRKTSCVCTYSTGDFGGIRVQSPLRAILSQLGCPPIKFGMFQPHVSKFFNKKGEPSDVIDAKKRFEVFFNELKWYAKAYKSKR